MSGMSTAYVIRNAQQGMRNYVDIGVLHYHVMLLDKIKDHKLYCDFVRRKIIPIIRLLFPELSHGREGQKKDYLTLAKELAARTISEVKVILKVIKQRLVSEGLVGISEIEKCIVFLNAILEFEPEVYFVSGVYDVNKKDISYFEKDESREGVFASPAKHIIAVDRLKDLCDAITALNRRDLVEEYVEAFMCSKTYDEDATVYQCNECFKQIRVNSLAQNNDIGYACPKCASELQKTLSQVAREVVHIEYFNEKTFVPSFFQLVRLDHSYWSNPAGAWEILYYVEWAWDIDNRDYFRKELWYGRHKITPQKAEKACVKEEYTPEACKRTMDWLSLNLMRLDIKNLKKSDKGDDDNEDTRGLILDRERIRESVNTIVKKYSQNAELSKSTYVPKELQLYIVDVDLRLAVVWDTGLVEIYKMHSFYADPSVLKFFDDLIKNPGKFFELSNAQQYLREAGIEGIFKVLFIAEVNKSGAMLNRDRVLLAHEDSSVQESVCAYIQELHSIGWSRVKEKK